MLLYMMVYYIYTYTQKTCISLVLSRHMYISYHICPRKHECLIGSIEHRFFFLQCLLTLFAKIQVQFYSKMFADHFAKGGENEPESRHELLCHLRGHWKVEPNSSKITAIATVTTRSFRRTVVHSQLLMDEMAQWMATAYAAFTAFECENGTAMVLQCCCCVLASCWWKWMPFLRIPHPRLLVQTLPKCLNRHPDCFCSTLLEENTSCFDPIHLLRCRVGISKEFSFCQTDRRKDNLFAGTAYLFPTCTCVQSKKLCCHLAQLCEWQLVLRSLDSYASWQFPVWNSRVNVVFVDYPMTNCIYCNDALNCRT